VGEKELANQEPVLLIFKKQSLPRSRMNLFFNVNSATTESVFHFRRTKMDEAQVKSVVDQEANRLIGVYRSGNDVRRKVKVGLALSLLALLSVIPDDTKSKKLLNIIKDLPIR
jgi:hypothetical protein